MNRYTRINDLLGQHASKTFLKDMTIEKYKKKNKSKCKNKRINTKHFVIEHKDREYDYIMDADIDLIDIDTFVRELDEEDNDDSNVDYADETEIKYTKNNDINDIKTDNISDIETDNDNNDINDISDISDIETDNESDIETDDESEDDNNRDDNIGDVDNGIMSDVDLVDNDDDIKTNKVGMIDNKKSVYVFNIDDLKKGISIVKAKYNTCLIEINKVKRYLEIKNKYDKGEITTDDVLNARLYPSIRLQLINNYEPLYTVEMYNKLVKRSNKYLKRIERYQKSIEILSGNILENNNDYLSDGDDNLNDLYDEAINIFS